MKQNIFQYSGSFYEHLQETAMYNSLFPVLATIFMTYFEKNPKSEGGYYTKVQFQSIKFTHKKEKDGRSLFLDKLVIIYILKFDVYRKEKSTLCYITSYTHHCFQHKRTGLHSLVRKLLTFHSNEKFLKGVKILKRFLLII